MVRRAAVVLAGGRGHRFQTIDKVWQDKAIALLEGKPLLIHTIENVSGVVDEVVVVVNNDDQRKLEYQTVLAKYNVKNVKIVMDLKINDLSGPIVAILSGLTYAKADYSLTVPVDMPLVNPKVANYLFDIIGGSYVAVPMWPNGKLETLLMVLERQKAFEIGNVLCRLSRSHPDDIIRGACRVLFVSPLGKVNTLDQELKTFVNINSREDLSRLQPRQVQGSRIEDLRLNLGNPPFGEIPLLLKAVSNRIKDDFWGASEIFSDCALKFEKLRIFFWAAVSRENEAKSLLSQSTTDLLRKAKDSFIKAATNYGLEAEVYEQNQCYVLAERAKSDKLWCQAKAERLVG
jgi:molybdopterin-guanine dinucleotide biosynthesis protein A